MSINSILGTRRMVNILLIDWSTSIVIMAIIYMLYKLVSNMTCLDFNENILSAYCIQVMTLFPSYVVSAAERVQG